MVSAIRFEFRMAVGPDPSVVIDPDLWQFVSGFWQLVSGIHYEFITTMVQDLRVISKHVLISHL
jgi:hypothetical protein